MVRQSQSRQPGIFLDCGHQREVWIVRNVFVRNENKTIVVFLCPNKSSDMHSLRHPVAACVSDGHDLEQVVPSFPVNSKVMDITPSSAQIVDNT